MAVSKDEILETIAGMTVMEVVDLIAAMEEKFGVTAAAAVAAAPAAAAEAAATEEQTEFNVVRAITGLGLKEAKDAVEGVPSTLKEGVSKEEAAEIKKQVEEAGGAIEIK